MGTPQHPRCPFWEVDLTYLNQMGFSLAAKEATLDEYKGGDFPLNRVQSL